MADNPESPTTDIADLHSAEKWALEHYPDGSQLRIWDERIGSADLDVQADEFALKFCFHQFKPTAIYVSLNPRWSVCFSWRKAPTTLEDLINDPANATAAKVFRDKGKHAWLLPKIAFIYNNIVERCFRTPPEPEEMHTVTGYDESLNEATGGIDLATIIAPELIKNGHRLTLHPGFSFEEQENGLLKFMFKFTTPNRTENRVWLIVAPLPAPWPNPRKPSKPKKAKEAYAEVHWSWRPEQGTSTRYWWPLYDFIEYRLPHSIENPCRRIAGEDILAQNKALYREMLDILFYTPVEPEEMHTITGYDESIQKQDLQIGAKLLNKAYPQAGLGKITRIDPKGILVHWERPFLGLGHDRYYDLKKFDIWKNVLEFPPPDIETMHTVTGYDEGLICQLEKAESFSMWQDTDKYVPVASEDDRELLYGIEEKQKSPEFPPGFFDAQSVKPFLAVGRLMEEISRNNRG